MIPTRRSLTMGVLATVLLALAGAGAAGALEVGQKAPDFSLVGPEGKPIKQLIG